MIGAAARIGVAFAPAIVGFCLMAFVSAVETVGDVSGICKGGAGREATDKEIEGATFADGIGTAVAGIFGGMPNTSFSQNVGLIAMTVFGALVANVCYVSWPRRIAFMAMALVVPILANGVRAFGTIYAAYWTSVERATGFDHIVYGWIFFGLVMAAVLAIGWRWFDRDPDAIAAGEAWPASS
mgnify:CR=1 FL=1